MELKGLDPTALYLVVVGFTSLAGLAGAFWGFIQWLKSRVKEEFKSDEFANIVTKILDGVLHSDKFRFMVRDVVAEAFTGREEADRARWGEVRDLRKEVIELKAQVEGLKGRMQSQRVTDIPKG
jgi:hypothetical protein